MDIFYFLSGMGVAVSLGRNSYGRFWRNRLLRLLPAWLLLSLVVWLSVDSPYWCKGSWLHCLFRYWFLNVLVVFYALSPLLICFVRRFGLVGIVIVALLLEGFSWFYLHTGLRQYLPWSLDFHVVRGVPRLPSYLLGLYLLAGQDGFRHALFRWWWVLTVLAGSVLVAFLFRDGDGAPMYRWIIASFAMPGGCYVLSRVLHSLPQKRLVEGAMFLFGSVSLELYLWHTPLCYYMFHARLAESHSGWVDSFVVFILLSLMGAWGARGCCALLPMFRKRLQRNH